MAALHLKIKATSIFRIKVVYICVNIMPAGIDDYICYHIFKHEVWLTFYLLCRGVVSVSNINCAYGTKNPFKVLLITTKLIVQNAFLCESARMKTCCREVTGCIKILCCKGLLS